ncbi:hypothetical protein Tco_0438724 [Tanacetum coccineum]
MKDPRLFTLPCRLGDSKPFDTLADLGSCVNLIPLYLLKKLKIGLLEESDHVFRGILATASAIIDCWKAKITVGEGITRSIFGVKEINLGDEDVPYWSTLRKRESYELRPSMDGIGAGPPYYAKKDFMDYHIPKEWEIGRDDELNPFKGVLVFRKMVEFL